MTNLKGGIFEIFCIVSEWCNINKSLISWSIVPLPDSHFCFLVSFRWKQTLQLTCNDEVLGNICRAETKGEEKQQQCVWVCCQNSWPSMIKLLFFPSGWRDSAIIEERSGSLFVFHWGCVVTHLWRKKDIKSKLWLLLFFKPAQRQFHRVSLSGGDTHWYWSLIQFAAAIFSLISAYYQKTLTGCLDTSKHFISKKVLELSFL